MVRYKVQAGRGDENAELVKAVYAELAEQRPAGLRYVTFRLPDGVSFMHVVIETDQPGRILGEVEAFRRFSADIESRCDEPPVATEIELVGSYGVTSAKLDSPVPPGSA
jgi:hypothetical protein